MKTNPDNSAWCYPAVEGQRFTGQLRPAW